VSYIYGWAGLVSIATLEMAVPRISANLPIYDPRKSTLAYGNRAIPKLVSSTIMDNHLAGSQTQRLSVPAYYWR